jgi:hypothetical protein
MNDRDFGLLMESMMQMSEMSSPVRFPAGRRRWSKGANGLWHSYDPVIKKRIELAAKRAIADAKRAIRRRNKIGRDRISAIRERFALVMTRNGWEKPAKGKRKWKRAA